MAAAAWRIGSGFRAASPSGEMEVATGQDGLRRALEEYRSTLGPRVQGRHQAQLGLEGEDVQLGVALPLLVRGETGLGRRHVEGDLGGIAPGLACGDRHPRPLRWRAPRPGG
jgi:hypothetical protein